jgi:crotonobetainyl-CoA:carnitine CoA-transferase CaiB-like acyl-CoA transferase
MVRNLPRYVLCLSLKKQAKPKLYPLSGTDACTVPVLTPLEATPLNYDSVLVPQPHPSLSHTPAVTASADLKAMTLRAGQHSQEILKEYNISNEEYRRLVKEEAIAGVGILPSFKL